ncbi:hypothetical protein CQW23_25523 [Capsicum baccatum]|uniref:Uncharacterized protein n=1 Tax=Capsicum baccatum TaxID=33114 RepID=A0A2G2VL86_CAPBA|nr:hypothetical protein CQW23_25523 [Capsicum baccatum]
MYSNPSFKNFVGDAMLKGEDGSLNVRDSQAFMVQDTCCGQALDSGYNIELGIPSEPSSSTMEQNMVETAEVEPKVITTKVEPNKYSISTHRLRRQIHKPRRRDRKANRLFLKQKKYLKKVLERFGMKDAKPISTPLAAHFKLSTSQSPQSEKKERYFTRSTRGKSIYGLSWKNTLAGSEMDFQILARYFKHMLDFGRNTNTLISFVDLDYTGDLDKRRSLYGNVFCIGGYAIGWKDTLQHIVALSTTKSE